MTPTACHRAVEIVEQRFVGPLADRLAVCDPGRDIVLHWLGQAGFLVQAGGRRILIDPYLSDTLAAKYRGTATPHERLMPAPIDVDTLGRVDLVLVTHHHTDHMDPGTLGPLARRHASLRFVVPRASRAEAVRRAGVTEERLILLDAGERVDIWPGLAVVAVRAAHETLERDAEGNHRFLGYALLVGKGRGVTVLHTGDTVPFEGQADEVARLRPDLLLVPVNGRSAARGVPGNMTLDEALDLTSRTGAAAMIAHHHGLFAFNTLPLAVIEQRAAAPDLPTRLLPAREGLEVRVRLT